MKIKQLTKRLDEKNEAIDGYLPYDIIGTHFVHQSTGKEEKGLKDPLEKGNGYEIEDVKTKSDGSIILKILVWSDDGITGFYPVDVSFDSAKEARKEGWKF